MIETDTLIGLIEKVVISKSKYTVPRIGKIVSVTDELNKGRVLVLIPSLGWDSDDKGSWCFSSDKKSLSIPKVDDYVLVEWIDGNPDLPIYGGVPTNMEDQIPEIYSGDPTSCVLFESNEKKMSAVFDEKNNKTTILNEGDLSLKTLKTLELLLKNSSINITEAGDIKIASKSGTLNLLNNGNIEVNGNTKNFVTHAELNTALQTFISALNVQLKAIAAGSVAAVAASGLWLTTLTLGGVTLDITASKTTTVVTGG